MTKKEAIKIFEEKKVRTVWDDETEEWFFSVVDVVAILTDSPNPSNYWKVLKHRLRKEGNESVTNCNQLKLPSTDGKYYTCVGAAMYSHIRQYSGSSYGWPKWQKSDWM